MSQQKSSPSTETKWYHETSGLRYKVQDRLSRLTRGRIRSPFYVGWLELQREKDDELQASSKIPESERADYLSVTSVEYFTPQNIHNLIDFLKSIKAAKGASTNANEIVRTFHSYRGRTGSSQYFSLSQPSNDSFTNIGYLYELPDFALRATVSVTNLTSSLTALTITFFVTQEERNDINRRLHLTYPVKLQLRDRGAVSTLNSREQQRAIIGDFEAKIRSELEQWFGRFRGGVFTSLNQVRPINYLLSTGSARPFTKRSKYPILDRLELEFARRVYVPLDVDPDLTIDAPCFAFRGFERRDKSTFICGSRAALDRATDSAHYGKDDLAPARYIDQYLQHSFAAIWLPDFLAAYRQEAVVVRDNIRRLTRMGSIGDPVSRLQRGLTHCAEGAMIANEIQSLPRQLNYLPSHLRAVNRRESANSKYRTLAGSLQKQVDDGCRQTIKELRELSNFIATQANLVNAIHSLKLQRVITVLTFVAIVVALASFLSSDTAREFWSSRIQSISTVH